MTIGTRFLSVLGLALALSGCQVTERIDQCQAIAKVLHEAAPALKKSPIEDNPEPKQLRKRARLYGQLSARLSQVSLTHSELKKEAAALSKDLITLEKELLLAAEIVSRHAQAAVERKKDPGPTPKAEDDAKRPTPSPSEDPAPRRTRVVAGLLSGRTSQDPWERKEQNYVREYGRASRNAEAAGRRVQEAVSDLNKMCR